MIYSQRGWGHFLLRKDRKDRDLRDPQDCTRLAEHYVVAPFLSRLPENDLVLVLVLVLVCPFLFSLDCFPCLYSFLSFLPLLYLSFFFCLSFYFRYLGCLFFSPFLSFSLYCLNSSVRVFKSILFCFLFPFLYDTWSITSFVLFAVVLYFSLSIFFCFMLFSFSQRTHTHFSSSALLPSFSLFFAEVWKGLLHCDDCSL